MTRHFVLKKNGWEKLKVTRETIEVGDILMEQDQFTEGYYSSESSKEASIERDSNNRVHPERRIYYSNKRKPKVRKAD
jgi:hypothetical protein